MGKKQKTPETLLVEGSAATEQLLVNLAAMTEHFNNLALRNALYLEFQMLMRMGRNEEANAIYDFLHCTCFMNAVGAYQLVVTHGYDSFGAL